VRVDDDLAVEDALVEHGRDEAFVEASQPLHQVARMRYRRDDLHVRLLLFQVMPDARQRSARAHARDEHVDLRQVPQDLRPRRLVVRARVHLVAVLVRHEVRRVFGRDLLRDLDRAVGAAYAVRVDDLGAERSQ